MELYDRPVIIEPVIEKVIPTTYVPNILAILDQIEIPMVKTREEKGERKQRKREEKKAEKKAKVENKQDKLDWHKRVLEMAARVDGSIPPVFYSDGGQFCDLDYCC